MGNLSNLFPTSKNIETGEVTKLEGGNSYSVLISGVTYSAISSSKLDVGDFVLLTKQGNKRYVLNSVNSFSKKRNEKVVYRNG